MTTRTMTGGAAVALLLAAVPLTAVPLTAVPAGAQDLAARVAAVNDGRVQLTFAPREGVCGDGRSFVRIGAHTYIGSWDGDRMDRERCAPGPVRVVATVRGGAVESLRHYVGPVPERAEGVTDLGMVAAPEAARWLLDVARRAPGRAASKAVEAVVLADSAVVWRDLLAIARDTDGRPRDVRQQAALWLSHFASAAASGAQPGELDFETGVGADGSGSDESEVKKSAVFALSQLKGNSGVPQLVDVARTNRDPAVRRSALFWLGQSGDPRGLAVFEELLSKAR